MQKCIKVFYFLIKSIQKNELFYALFINDSRNIFLKLQKNDNKVTTNTKLIK